MYPTERYSYLLEHLPKDMKERIAEYVDESHHQDVTLKDLGMRSWKDVIAALIRYETDRSGRVRDTYLIEDYALYKTEL